MIAESQTKLGTEGLPLRGWQRAGALVRFFGPQSTAKDDNGLTPDVVFAPRVGPRSESARAIEIVTPLVDCWEKLGRRPSISKAITAR